MIDDGIRSITTHYCPLSAESIADFRRCVRVVQARKGDLLVREGQYSDKLYYLLKGCARAYYLKDGRVITDWFAFEHEFICAITSYFLDVPSPHYIEMLEDATLMVVSRDDMNRLCDRHHDLERLGRIGVTKTMLQLQQRVVSLQFESARQRYLNLVAVYPAIELRVPLGDMASFLGITQETLSRIRATDARI